MIGCDFLELNRRTTKVVEENKHDVTKIRRRIKDHLRKYATGEDIVRLALYLGVPVNNLLGQRTAKHRIVLSGTPHRTVLGTPHRMAWQGPLIEGMHSVDRPPEQSSLLYKIILQFL